MNRIIISPSKGDIQLLWCFLPHLSQLLIFQSYNFIKQRMFQDSLIFFQQKFQTLENFTILYLQKLMRPSTKNHIQPFLFFITAVLSQLYNVCNPTFQDPVIVPVTGQYHAIPNNYLCWYCLSSTSWMLQKVSTPLGSTRGAGIDLNKIYTGICQKFSMPGSLNKTVRLEFDSFSSPEMVQTSFSVVLNNQTTIYSFSEIIPGIIRHHMVDFDALTQANQICIFAVSPSTNFIVDNFALQDAPIPINNNSNTTNTSANSNETTINSTNSTSGNSTKNIDLTNSTFANMQSEDIVIQFNLRHEENTNNLFFQSNLTHDYKPGLQKFIEENIQIKDNEKIFGNIQTGINQNGRIYIELNADQNILLALLSIRFKKAYQASQSVVQFTAIITKSHYQCFYLMTQKQKSVYNNIQPLALEVGKIFSKVKTWIQATFCSYFIANLLAFWNLSILYNFLNIPMTPNFSKETLQEMAHFYLESTITKWITDTMNLPEDTFKYSLMKYETEWMPEEKFGFLWFGSMGLTTSVIDNVQQIGIIMGLLFIKILILRKMIKIFSKPFFILAGIQTNTRLVLATEFIPMIPFLCIAVTEGLDQGSLTFYDTLQKTFQSFIFYLCCIGIALWYLAKRNVFYYEKKVRNKKKDCKKADPETLNQLAESIMNLSIPLCLVLANARWFIIINSIILGFRFVVFIHLFKHLGKSNKVFGLLINIVWLFHHSAFTVLLVIGETWENYEDKVALFELCTICGFVSICTVLLGGAIELIRSLLEILSCLIYFIKVSMIVSTKKKQKQNEQKPDEQKPGEQNKPETQQQRSSKGPVYFIELIQPIKQNEPIRKYEIKQEDREQYRRNLKRLAASENRKAKKQTSSKNKQKTKEFYFENNEEPTILETVKRKLNFKSNKVKASKT